MIRGSRRGSVARRHSVLTLPTGASLNFDASALALGDGASVATWTDSSGNGHDATQATGGAQPTFRSSAGGKAAVQFDGGDWLSVGGAGATFQNVSGGTVYVVCEDTSALGAANRNVLFMSTTGSGSARWSVGTFGTQIRTGGRRTDSQVESAIFNTSGTVTASTRMLITSAADYSRALLIAFMDGTKTGSNNPFPGTTTGGGSTTNTASAQVSIGCTGAGTSEFWTGYIRQIVVYPVEHTYAERRQAENYLRAKWSTPAIPDPFTTAIPGSPVVDTNSTALVESYRRRDLGAGNVPQTGTDFTAYTATGSDLSVTVTATAFGNNPFAPWNPIRIPAGAVPSNTSDHWLIVTQPNGLVAMIWYSSSWSPAIPSAPTTAEYAAAQWGAVYDPDQHLVPLTGSASGAGIDMLTGLITAADLADPNGVPHAMMCASGHIDSATFRYPATRTDGTYTSAGGLGLFGIPEGTRFQLDPAADLSGVSDANQLAVAKGLQNYGLYVRDQTTNVRGVIDIISGLTENTQLTQIPWASLRALSHWDGT